MAPWWLTVATIFWFCFIYTATVSIVNVANLSRFFHVTILIENIIQVFITTSRQFKCVFPGLKITAGQRTLSGLIADLTGQTPVLPVILTGHFWIQTFHFPYSCRLMLYNAAMISFFFGVFCCFALNPSKKKNAAIN